MIHGLYNVKLTDTGVPPITLRESCLWPSRGKTEFIVRVLLAVPYEQPYDLSTVYVILYIFASNIGPKWNSGKK